MKKTSLFYLIFLLLLTINGHTAHGQGMSVNTTGSVADNSAMLDVGSTTKGLLAPRMTTTQRTAITLPATGLLVYDLTLNTYYFNSGTPTSAVWTAAGGMAAGTSTGEILYWNGTAWAGVATGSSGQFLSLVSGIPTWVTLPFYNISASSGPNGTISPNGVVGVGARDTQVYSFTPNGGYIVGNITVDGVCLGPMSSYSFNSVTTSHTISVAFIPSSSYLFIGESYEGGSIGYILLPCDSGYSSTTPHGLIAATSDQSAGTVWGCNDTTTGATGFTIGTGAANTLAILSTCTTSGIAAQLCYAYSGGGYTDWYLPSLYELDKLYLHEATIGGFSSSMYWSSTEQTAGNSWMIDFSNGDEGPRAKTTTYRVRAIRSF